MAKKRKPKVPTSLEPVDPVEYGFKCPHCEAPIDRTNLCSARCDKYMARMKSEDTLPIHSVGNSPDKSPVGSGARCLHCNSIVDSTGWRPIVTFCFETGGYYQHRDDPTDKLHVTKITGDKARVVTPDGNSVRPVDLTTKDYFPITKFQFEYVEHSHEGEEPVVTLEIPIDDCEAAEGQIEELANVIMREVPGEPSQDEGAVACAIRLIRGSLEEPLPERKVDIREELVADAEQFKQDQPEHFFFRTGRFYRHKKSRGRSLCMGVIVDKEDGFINPVMETNDASRMFLAYNVHSYETVDTSCYEEITSEEFTAIDNRAWLIEHDKKVREYFEQDELNELASRAMWWHKHTPNPFWKRDYLDLAMAAHHLDRAIMGTMEKDVLTTDGAGSLSWKSTCSCKEEPSIEGEPEIINLGEKE